MPTRAASVAAFAQQHGGRLQRAAAVERLGPGSSSKLVDVLVEFWGWRSISANMLQDIANAACEDFRAWVPTDLRLQPPPKWEQLAKLGGHGQHPNNVRRDLLRACPVTECVPRAVLINVPCKTTKMNLASLPIDTNIPIMLPSVVLETLWRYHPNLFSKFIGPGLPKFWGTIKDGDPRLWMNPMTRIADWQQKFIPLILHGDGVRFTMRGNNLLCVQFAGLLSVGFSWLDIWHIVNFPKSCRTYATDHGPSNDTWQRIWAFIHHDLAACFHGVHPLLDPDGAEWPEASLNRAYAGQPLCGGMRAIVWTIASDYEFAVNELGFPHWNKPQPCGWCPCTKADVQDARLDAPWKLELYEPHREPFVVSPHVVWRLPGISRFTYMGDWQHGWDLGPIVRLLGSTFNDLIAVDSKPYSGNIQMRWAGLWADIQWAYDKLGIVHGRLQTLTPKMASDKKGFLQCKSAVAKTLIAPVLEILKKWYDGSELAGHRLVCFENALQIYDTVAAHGLVMPDAAAQTILGCIERFLLHLSACGDISTGRYTMVTKCHYIWHIFGQFARWQSPKAASCYPFEDHVGKIQQAAAACATAVPMHRVPAKFRDSYERVLMVYLRRNARSM